MLKGVNKQIIEITNPQSPYFDKIIFFVSEKGGQNTKSELESEAFKVSSEMKKPPRQKITKNQVMTFTLNFFLGIGAGGMIIMLLNYFLK